MCALESDKCVELTMCAQGEREGGMEEGGVGRGGWGTERSTEAHTLSHPHTRAHTHAINAHTHNKRARALATVSPTDPCLSN